MEQDFFSKLYKNSPIEVATIQQVHKTVIPSGREGANVQIPHFTCTIVTGGEATRRFENIPWLSPYLNPRTGAGVYVVPKPRTKVLIAYAQGGQPYILGWLSPIGLDGRHTANREPVPEGSTVIATDFGNKVMVLEGGIVRIQSSPFCRRQYLPTLDQIRDFCRNYVLTTSSGTFSFTESADRKRYTSWTIEEFTKAGKQGDRVRMQFGHHTEDDPGEGDLATRIFSLLVGAGTQIYIDPSGQIKIVNENPSGDSNIQIDNDGNFTLNNTKGFSVNTETGAIAFTAGTSGNTRLVMDPNGNILIKAVGNTVTIQATSVNLQADTVLLAGGGRGVARLMDRVLVSHEGWNTGWIIEGSTKVFSG